MPRGRRAAHSGAPAYRGHGISCLRAGGAAPSIKRRRARWASCRIGGARRHASIALAKACVDGLCHVPSSAAATSRKKGARARRRGMAAIAALGGDKKAAKKGRYHRRPAFFGVPLRCREKASARAVGVIIGRAHRRVGPGGARRARRRTSALPGGNSGLLLLLSAEINRLKLDTAACGIAVVAAAAAGRSLRAQNALSTNVAAGGGVEGPECALKARRCPMRCGRRRDAACETMWLVSYGPD